MGRDFRGKHFSCQSLGYVPQPRLCSWLRHTPLLIIAIVLGGIILDIIVLAAIAYFTGFVFYILLFFPLMVAFWAVRALRTFNVRCYVFKNGFIYARGRKYRVVSWDQIVAVFQKHTAGRYSSSHTYTVRVQEGREIQIGDAVNRVIDLGAMIQREVTKLLLPRAIASYKSGETPLLWQGQR